MTLLWGDIDEPAEDSITHTLSKGDIVYHGTEWKEFQLINEPIFASSNIEVAKYFACLYGHVNMDEYVVQLEVIDSLNLVCLNADERPYLYQTKFDGWIKNSFYTKEKYPVIGNDILIMDPKSKLNILNIFKKDVVPNP